MEQEYDKLTEKYQISARKYFWVLRLAIYHVDGKDLNSSFETSQYPKSNEVYKVACRILEALYADDKNLEPYKVRLPKCENEEDLVFYNID